MSSPTITSITPNHGSYHGGTPIEIVGTDFLANPTVTVGGVSATSIVRVDATHITCDTPAGTAGAQDVVVTNTDTGTVTEVGGYTYEAVSVVSVTPDHGSYHGGTAVTIVGTGFYTGATVEFDAVAATSVVVVDENTITCVTPAGTAGDVDVVVENLDTETDTLTDGYTYEAISVVSITPNDGTPSGGTPVTISGTGFYTGATVEFDAVAATSVVVVNENTITAVSPAGTGVVDITVTNLDTETDTLAASYSYLVQSVSSVTVPSRIGEGGAGIFRSSPGLGDVLNKIADNLEFIKTAAAQASFAEFKTAMEDIDTLGVDPAPYFGRYVQDTSGDVQVPERTGEGFVGLNRAQTSEKGVGLKQLLDRVATMLAEIKTASQSVDYAAFKVAMAAMSVLNKSDDSRI